MKNTTTGNVLQSSSCNAANARCRGQRGVSSRRFATLWNRVLDEFVSQHFRRGQIAAASETKSVDRGNTGLPQHSRFTQAAMKRIVDAGRQGRLARVQLNESVVDRRGRVIWRDNIPVVIFIIAMLLCVLVSLISQRR